MCTTNGSGLTGTYLHFFFVPILLDGSMIFVLVYLKSHDNIKKYGVNIWGSANHFAHILFKDSAIGFVMSVVRL